MFDNRAKVANVRIGDKGEITFECPTKNDALKAVSVMRRLVSNETRSSIILNEDDTVIITFYQGVENV